MTALKKTQEVTQAASKPQSNLRPVRELVANHQKMLEMSNIELAHRLGYANGNVIAMLKAGTMKLPPDKIGLAAAALQIDPLYLAQCANADQDWGIDVLLEAVSRRTPITANEEKMILHMRKLAQGDDVDLDEHPVEREVIMHAFADAVKRVKNETEGRLERLREKTRSAIRR